MELVSNLTGSPISTGVPHIIDIGIGNSLTAQECADAFDLLPAHGNVLALSNPTGMHTHVVYKVDILQQTTYFSSKIQKVV